MFIRSSGIHSYSDYVGFDVLVITEDVQKLKELMDMDHCDVDSILKCMYEKEDLVKIIKKKVELVGFAWNSLGISFNTGMLTIEGKYIPGGIVEVVNDEQLEEVNRLRLGWLEHKEIFKLLETKGIKRLHLGGVDCVGIDFPVPSMVAQAFLVKKEGILYRSGFYYRVGIVGTLWREAMSVLKPFICLSFSDEHAAFVIARGGDFMRHDRSRWGMGTY